MAPDPALRSTVESDPPSMPDAPPSRIAELLRECLTLVDAEDRVEVRAVQDRLDDHRAEACRFGGLIAELGRQIVPLARRGDQELARTELGALGRRLTQLGNAYADGRDWRGR
jgi:hypothetical protein